MSDETSRSGFPAHNLGETVTGHLVSEMESYRERIEDGLCAGDAEGVLRLLRQRGRLVRGIPATVLDPEVRLRILRQTATEDQDWIARARMISVGIRSKIEAARSDRHNCRNLSRAYGNGIVDCRILSSPG